MVNMTLEHDEIVFKGDILRKKYDIRNVPEKGLNTYQKTQVRAIKKYLKEYEDVEIGRAIRRTLDGILLEDLGDIESLNNVGTPREQIVMKAEEVLE